MASNIRFSLISIPYGAIKRYFNEVSKFFINAFQFLMVRLKAKTGKLLLKNNSKFQFLMVRLKGYLLIKVVYQLHLFQFLMVRLKEKFSILNSTWNKRFQFLMVRLKAF